MTLVAGYKSRDGFVIASDTEVTFGPILYQSKKLSQYFGEQAPYDIVIGGAGDSSYVAMMAQKIGEAIKALGDPPVQNMKNEVERLILEVHDNYIYKHWTADDPDAPTVSLVVGMKDSKREIMVLKTDRTAIAIIDSWGFVGSGAVLAEYLAEKLFMPGLSTAVMIHLVLQLFRELKIKGAYVGGNTEIHAVRRGNDAELFFNLEEIEDQRFLWGLDEVLGQAVRIALDKDKAAKFLENRIRFISKRLRALRKLADAEPRAYADGVTVTEYGLGSFGNIFRDVG